MKKKNGINFILWALLFFKVLKSNEYLKLNIKKFDKVSTSWVFFSLSKVHLYIKRVSILKFLHK